MAGVALAACFYRVVCGLGSINGLLKAIRGQVIASTSATSLYEGMKRKVELIKTGANAILRGQNRTIFLTSIILPTCVHVVQSRRLMLDSP